MYCVPGNHDIDRDRQNLCFLGARASLVDQNKVDLVLAGGEDLSTLLERQQNYRSFQGSYFNGQDRTATPDTLAYVSRLEIDEVRLAIVGLDSAWLSEGGVGDHGRLILGERQVINALRLTQEYKDRPHVVLAMAHHPFHSLSTHDRPGVEQRIERSCQFFHYGHLHEPEARATGFGPSGCLALAVGSSFQTRLSRNSFSIVKLDLLYGVRIVETMAYRQRSSAFASTSVENSSIRDRPSKRPFLLVLSRRR